MSISKEQALEALRTLNTMAEGFVASKSNLAEEKPFWDKRVSACETLRSYLEQSGEPVDVDALAQEIRRVDGNHDMGAGALAEALVEKFLRPFYGDPRPAPSLALEWQPIETAPKSLAEGSHIRSVYLLGYCPDDSVDPEGCISAIWWEPLQRCTLGKRRGLMGTWFADGAIESEPTHWMPLPAPPVKEGK